MSRYALVMMMIALAVARVADAQPAFASAADRAYDASRACRADDAEPADRADDASGARRCRRPGRRHRTARRGRTGGAAGRRPSRRQPKRGDFDAGGQVRLPSGPDDAGKFATYNWIAADLKGRYFLLDTVTVNGNIPLAVKKPDMLMSTARTRA